VVIGGVAKPDSAGGAYLFVENPRYVLTHMAATMWPGQPDAVAAVTGTNGKTSVTVFLRHIWMQSGLTAASLGTIGINPEAIAEKLDRTLLEQLKLTTASPLALHQCLSDLARHGVTHLAIEASSHGLDQQRLAATKIAVAGFTNLTQDHLDYHKTMAAYFEAKARLFLELLPADKPVVINIDDPYGQDLAERCRCRGMRVIDYSIQGKMAFLSADYAGGHPSFNLRIAEEEYRVSLPVIGAFQVANILCALGMAIMTGVTVSRAVAALESLTSAPGRLELIGQTHTGGRVFIDYAHTPDAIATILQTVRSFTTGKVVIVFGAGGNRDAAKRPLMGQVAAEFADHVIITDDNPRFEDPAMIRAAIMATCPKAWVIGDRAKAIEIAMTALQKDDTLVVAGKGHENGQIIGDMVHPFSDRLVVQGILGKYHDLDT
jgi:UDP-N-acetylmuramoyl-L-alanyl-D-glutamate--2,6-diaminopimelate ligase